MTTTRRPSPPRLTPQPAPLDTTEDEPTRSTTSATAVDTTRSLRTSKGDISVTTSSSGSGGVASSTIEPWLVGVIGGAIALVVLLLLVVVVVVVVARCKRRSAPSNDATNLQCDKVDVFMFSRFSILHVGVFFAPAVSNPTRDQHYGESSFQDVDTDISGKDCLLVLLDDSFMLIIVWSNQFKRREICIMAKVLWRQFEKAN